MTEIQKEINAGFDRLEKATLINAKPVLDIEEAALFTGYSVKGLYALTSKRQIPHYKRNGKLYFKKEELVAWMTEQKILTDKEMNGKAETYTATH